MATNKQIIEFQGKGVTKLKAQYKELENRTKRLEGATRKSSSSLGGMAAALGLTTAALYGTMRAMSGVVRVGRQFEKNMSNVAAISGATGAELAGLERNARSLGATTVFTASQVADLQVEFAKLGFSSKEIRGVTKDTLALASATGSDLSTSAAVAGGTLRAFGLDVSETSRITDTMALSFSSSALDMDKFTNSMTYVGPIAKAAGIDVEGATAMLGTLANSMISGSMAGTSLRKILLEAGKEGSKLAKRFGGPVKSMADFQKGLLKLRKEGFDVMAEGADLVGARAVTAFGVLLDGVEKTDVLAESLSHAGGAAQKMADTQLDNLDGSLTLLNSAMEGLGLRLFEFVGGPLRGMVDGVTEFTQEIDEDTIRSLTAFAVGITTVTVSIKAYRTAIRLAKIETAAFQATLAATGWGVAVIGAGLVLGKILDLTGALEGEDTAMKKTNKSVDDHTEKVTKAATAYDKLKEQVTNLVPEGYETFWDFAENATDEQIENWFLIGERMDEVRKQTEGFKLELKKTSDEIISVTPVMVEQAEIIQNTLSENISGYASMIQGTVDNAAQLTDGIMEVSNKFTEMEMQNIDNKRQKEIDAAMASGLNEEAKQAKIQNIKEKYAKQERDLRKKQKAPMIAQAIANTAVGVTKALEQSGPLGIALGVLVAAAGALEVATISAQEFATGGDFVTSGPQMIKVGDNPGGAERVQVTPLSSPNINGPQGGGGITLNISAPLVDETILDVILPAIEKAGRMNLA